MACCLSLLRIRLIAGLQFRSAVLASALKRLLWGLLELLAFAAVYRESGTLPMSWRELVSYVWMQQGLFSLFQVVWSDGEIYSAISDGSIAYELIRPMNLYSRWFVIACANRLAPTALTGLPVLLCAFLLPEPWRMTLPPRLGLSALALLSSALALCVVVAFAMLLYTLLFYTTSYRGVRVATTALVTFLSGGLLPLPFFPERLLTAVELSPFACMQNMPLRIWSGELSGADALWGVGLQLLWLGILLLAGQLWMRRALRRVTAQGG